MSSGLLSVYEIVCIVVQRPADDEWTLPRGGQLVLTRRLLDSAEHQVALTKSEGADLLAVVVAQLLLVDCRPGQGQQARFFSEIDAVFSSLLGFLLSIHDATRCIELDVGGDDCLGAIYEEEWSKSS